MIMEELSEKQFNLPHGVIKVIRFVTDEMASGFLEI